jgi:hypothetical protein
MVHQAIQVPSLPESKPLPSARSFAEYFLSGTRQSPTLGNDPFCQVQDTRYRNTLGKDIFAECRTLGKGDARQRAVSGRLKMTLVNLCRGPRVGTRQRGFFAECQPADTRQRPLYRVPFLGTRQIGFFAECQPADTRQRPLYRVPFLDTR